MNHHDPRTRRFRQTLRSLRLRVGVCVLALPALLFLPASAEGLLLHAHRGHDVHLHAADPWDATRDHGGSHDHHHADHHHDADRDHPHGHEHPSNGDEAGGVLVDACTLRIEIPAGPEPVRGVATTTLAKTPTSRIAAIDPPPVPAIPRIRGPALRARFPIRDLIRSPLLESHALLL